MTATPTLQAVELPGGLTVPYLEQGDRDGVPRILLPRSQLKVYAGGGHAMHWEEPGRFAADVAEFASTVT